MRCFSCVCPVIDHELSHNVVKVAVDSRGDSRGRGVKLKSKHEKNARQKCEILQSDESNITSSSHKGRTIRKVMRGGGGGGVFSADTNFFFRALLVQEFFFQVKTPARAFF